MKVKAQFYSATTDYPRFKPFTFNYDVVSSPADNCTRILKLATQRVMQTGTMFLNKRNTFLRMSPTSKWKQTGFFTFVRYFKSISHTEFKLVLTFPNNVYPYKPKEKN